MKKVYLDFETRSEVSIWDVGAWIYSTHPSTRILCFAFAVDGGKVYLNDEQKLRQLAENDNLLFVAHNAFFERVIWKNIMVKRFNYLPIQLRRWRDTMAKGCAFGLPLALNKAADALMIGQKKDMRARQIMKRMSKPLFNKKGEVYYDDDPGHYKILYEYCKQDVRVEREIDRIVPELSPKEQEIWFYDQLINERGVMVDIPAVKRIIEILSQKTKALNKELVQLTGGKVTKGTQVQSMLNYLADNGCYMPNLQKATVKAKIASKELADKHIRILRLRQQLGRTSTKKYEKLIHSTDDKGILRDCYIYHGANPGRWAGKLVQLQNLSYDKSGEIDPEKAINEITTLSVPMLEMAYSGRLVDVIAKCIRGVFIPPPGQEFYVVDYGAIEARVLMWLAGEKMGLREFKKADAGQDEDIYVKMARRIYGRPSLTKAKNQKERALGKSTILGSGYGMGGSKFCVVCEGNGIKIDEETGHKIIHLYRNTYKTIPLFWSKLEQAMLNAFNYKDKIYKVNNIYYVYKGHNIYCKLPSGRILTYIEPKLIDNRFGGKSLSFMAEVNSQWVRKDTFGGLLAENVTQATARDIMAYSFPSLERNGFPIVMHTHDEIVSQQSIGKNRLDKMIELMCELEPWAKGCPIVAEGFTCKRYKKG
jgi:DNA polymerase